MRPSSIVIVPVTIGVRIGPSSVACSDGLPGAADVRDEALQDAEARGAVGAHRDPLVVQIDEARDVELRLVADQPHVGDA